MEYFSGAGGSNIICISGKKKSGHGTNGVYISMALVGVHTGLSHLHSEGIDINKASNESTAPHCRL